MNEKQMKYHMRLRVYYNERNFGPGVAELMLHVKELGSISAACNTMNMSYSKAWKIVKNAETDLGIKLMHGIRGGENGGNTVLTKEGEDFLDTYLSFEKEAGTAVAKIFKKYYGC